jgi:hypothetical protein
VRCAHPAPIASSDEAAAVAWRYQSEDPLDGGEWLLSGTKPNRRTVEPLYTHPAAAQQSRAEVLTEDWARETMSRQHDLMVDVLAQLKRIQTALGDTRPKQAVGEMVEHAISLLVKP